MIPLKEQQVYPLCYILLAIAQLELLLFNFNPEEMIFLHSSHAAYLVSQVQQLSDAVVLTVPSNGCLFIPERCRYFLQLACEIAE